MRAAVTGTTDSDFVSGVYRIGAQYQYTKLRYDRGRLATELGGTYQYDGVQVPVSVAF